MPLYPIRSPCVPVRSFRSLVFDNSLEILLESPGQVKPRLSCDIALLGSVTGIDETALLAFIKRTKHDPTGSFTLNPTFRIDLDTRTIYVKGYRLHSFGGGETYLCSSSAEEEHAISYSFTNEVALTTLYYVYHMMTCV